MLNLLTAFLPRLSLGLVGAGKLGVADNTSLSTTGVREGKTGEQVVGQAHGKYYEAASRGNLYSITNATARSPQLALGVTAPLLLYNPIGSNKFLVVKKASFGQAGSTTNTLGTGTMLHAIFTLSGPVATQSGTAPVVGGGAVVTPKNCLIGAPNNSVAQCWELATLNAAPIAAYPFLNISETAAATIGGNSMTNSEDVDGAIVLGPGSGYTIQAIMAAGAGPLGFFGIVFEEVPIS